MRLPYLASSLLALWTVALAPSQTLPQLDPPFHGKTDIDPAKSTPDWPKPVAAPKGAPNVVLILLDDVGFAATSTFGGAAPTPALDRLAAGGLRYNRFHVNAMCSPTRAALLSGRNSHEVGFGMIAESAVGYPGYNAMWPQSSAGIAEVLKLNGYSTAAFGKWHNTPVWDVNPAGPFNRWPIGLGFEYFYGFLGAATSQWEPNIYRNVSAVEAPANPKERYHLTNDLANDAIAWVRRHDVMQPSKPFFLYFATGATHSPHHVPKEWVDKFKGKFNMGWDKLRADTFARQKELGVIPANAVLTPRPKEMVAWDSLDADQKKLLAHQMEVYAGFLAHTDYQVGRLLEAIRAEGHIEDTAVIYIAGDNGASAEGGVDGRDAVNAEGRPLNLGERWNQYDELGSESFTNMYATAWAWATNSPFQWAKRVASHLGGTRDAMVVSYPGHVKGGGLRTQFSHVIDIAPTIFELAGVKPPAVVNGVKQTPLEGVSLAYSFDHPDEPSRHKVQYFEMLGSRGIYKDGWWAGSFNHLPWNGPADGTPTLPVDQRPWELYNLEQDYSQAHNLATQNPQKLEELKKLFDAEARRNNVYPLEPGRTAPQPSPSAGRTHFVYHEGDRRIPPGAGPRLAGRAHRIDAEIMVPASGAEGVIVAQGGRQGGFTLYVKDGRVTYETSSFGHMSGSLVSSEPLGPGKASIVVEVTPAGRVDPATQVLLAGRAPMPVMARLMVNGKPAGEARCSFAGAGDTLDIGSDLVSPVSAKYASPFAFTGKIDAVTIDLR